jgi:hypothetical protein
VTPVTLQLVDVMNRRFVLVRGERPARRGKELVEALAPDRVIFRRGVGAGAIYYLLTVPEALSLLTVEGKAESALATAEFAPVPAFDAGTPADEAPDRCIVLDQGELAGFFDVDVDLPDIQRGRGPRGLEPEGVPRVLTAEMEREVALGQTASLLVFLGLPSGDGEAERPVTLPLGSIVNIHLRLFPGFELDGPRDVQLEVTYGPETLPAQFLLRAVAPGEGQIEILAFHQGGCLGRLVLTATVLSEQPAARPPARYERQLYPGGASDPDLSLIIHEVRDRNQPALVLQIWPDASAGPMLTLGPIQLKMDPARYFTEFFRQLGNLSSPDEHNRARAMDRLKRKGAKLFQDIFPPELQEHLWSWRGRIRSLRIESGEPWIPWELCRLVGREGRRIEESGFLCEELIMARWVLGERRKPGLRMRRIGVIAADDSELRGVEEEQRRLLGLNGENLQVQSIACRRQAVLQAFASGDFDGIHFAGHGLHRDLDVEGSWLVLDQGEDLWPDDLSGEVGNLGNTWPLAFLNSCQSGRAGFSLTHLGGWAPALLRAGAGAFLGPLWAVSDQGAEFFARSFYQALLTEKKSIGEAVRQARLAVRTEMPGDPAWLAYTLFAEPLARVVGAGSAADVGYPLLS